MNDFYYSFTHRKSGRKVISQSWKEMWEMQSSSDFGEYHRLGIAPRPRSSINTTSSYAAEERLNKFWKGAEGYEKAGRINCSGISTVILFTGFRMFIKHVHNCACMEGDISTIHKARSLDEIFHCNGVLERLCLPPHQG